MNIPSRLETLWLGEGALQDTNREWNGKRRSDHRLLRCYVKAFGVSLYIDD